MLEPFRPPQKAAPVKPAWAAMYPEAVSWQVVDRPVQAPRQPAKM